MTVDLQGPRSMLVPLLVCIALVGCDRREAPASAVREAEEPALVGAPLMAAKPATPDPREFPQVNEQFVPANPQLPPTGLPTANDLPPVKVVPGYEPVGFARLAGYLYETDASIAGAHTPRSVSSNAGPPRKGDEQIPPDIKELDGKPITVQGYMVPIDFRKGGTNEFILVSVIPSCFFCQVPMPNQWIEVKMKNGDRVPYPGDGLITVAGTISVGALFEGEYFRNLYRMEGHQVVTH
jgi:hypothetical protein